MVSVASHTHRTTARPSAVKHDAIVLLKADHKEVAAMLREFQKSRTAEKKKTELVRKICQALRVHAQIEEEIFYPAAREALNDAGEDLLNEAEVEHSSIKDLVASLESGSSEDQLYDAEVKVLGEYVRHHVKEEEEELFPKIRKTKLDLKELGAELAARKAELMGKFDGKGS